MMALAMLNPQFKKSSPDGGMFSDQTSSPQALPLRSYLCLSVLTCFCPAFPVNLLGLVFSIMSRNSYSRGDYDGSRRLGRNALFVGVASVIIGLIIIAVTCAVQLT